jgi:quercetin dioxygenase-like cupin family protein
MIVRMYSGNDGQSHFEEVSPAFAPADLQERTAPEQTEGVSFGRAQPGYFSDWHNAPRRQYVVTLAGEVEIGLADGTLRRFGPGDVLLAEDLTGHGHTTRVVSSEPRITLTIPLRG